MFGIEIPALLSAGLLNYGRKALAYLAVFVSGFLAGYLLCWHNNSVKEAEKTGIQETAQAATSAGSKAIDSAVSASRDSRIADARNGTAVIAQQLEKARHEKPADISCRLPDGVLATINGQLGTDQPGSASVVRQ